ncbi:hypothetical protein MLD38_026792 [Melastoma candidum]|uniref:Uncharacterized protein n=1 Tax=Melastoma candidum TaxID=119954 RepID=A0ACB9P0L6_9MYRT|nr:hypothetical protein MLD38_026792 [Melastoma candidum]
MAYRRRSTAESILDVFALNPLPYPVLLILAVLLVFLGTSWYFSYEEAIETAQEQLGWALFATPIALVILVRWLSSLGEAGNFLAGGNSPWERQRRQRMYGGLSGDGAASPWGVAALIVLVLVLLQFQSSFLESWFIFS